MYQDPAGNRYADHEYYEGTNIRKFKLKYLSRPDIEIETVDRAIRYLLRKYEEEEKQINKEIEPVMMRPEGMKTRKFKELNLELAYTEGKKEALINLIREINWHDGMMYFVKGEWRLDNYQFEDED